jgi:adenylate kinase family enzyme
MKNTIVINLFGGPGVGKSTLCASVFAKLKIMGIDCEMATEYAKDMVWEESYKKLENQIYIFGKQHARVHRLLGIVYVVITDSPLLNSIVYDKTNNVALKKLVISEFWKLNTLNFYIARKLDYEENGRVQTLKQAIDVDNAYLKLIKDNDIIYSEIEPGDVDTIIEKILTKIDE